MAEIPTEALEATARALFTHDRMTEDPEWEDLPDYEQHSYRTAMAIALGAAAPTLIAEGRRQAAAAIGATYVVAELSRYIDWLRESLCSPCRAGVCSAHRSAKDFVSAIAGGSDDG